MRIKRAWTFKSFLTCLVWNGILVGLFFYAAQQVLQGLHMWVNPLLAQGNQNVPQEFHSALVNMKHFLDQTEHYLIPAVFGVGGVLTFFLWLFVMFQGRGLVNRTLKEAQAAPAPSGKAAKKKTRATESKPQAAPAQEPYTQPSPQAAVQLLAILQREGRLVDFLQEDLSLYEDAQIGAAVRNIHEGCKTALAEYVKLKPVFEEEEGHEITILAGFDAGAIRLTGEVSGDPPFKGIVRHRGWQVAKLQLPQITTERKKDWILAPAEVEIEAEK